MASAFEPSTVFAARSYKKYLIAFISIIRLDGAGSIGGIFLGVSSFATPTNSSRRRRRRLNCGRLIRDAPPMLSVASRLTIRTTVGFETARKFFPPSPLTMSSRKRPSTTPLRGSSGGSAALPERANENGEPKRERRRRPLVIVLAGPTAVGKSDVAAELCSPATAAEISQGHWFSSREERSDADEIGMMETAILATRGHVVSADSVQAYRGVDVGANKPTAEEMVRTPHHLLDVVDPPADPSRAASYNAADWMRDARHVIWTLTSFDGGAEDNEEEMDETNMNDVARKRRECIENNLSRHLGVSNDNEAPTPEKTIILPVVVGGTMMYLQWLVHGRPDAIRPTDEAVDRAVKKIDEHRQEARMLGARKSNESLVESVENDNNDAAMKDDPSDMAAWNAASAYVSTLGPVFARRVQKLPGRDWYRLRRLLEVAYTIAPTKKAAREGDADEQTEKKTLRNLTDKEVYTGMRSGSLPDLGYDVRCFFLCPDERMAHFHTVDRRCEQMLLRGLLPEVARLRAAGELPDGSQAARAIGYRQALGYLSRGDARRDDRMALAAFVDDFATATRQYAKKQMQWFRKDAKFAFVPVQMEWDKAKRVAEATKTIAHMCKMRRADFDAELSSGKDGSGEGDELPLSARTKFDNERQGKKMKFFASRRTRLIEGSDDFLAVLAEADECTKKVQGLGEEF